MAYDTERRGLQDALHLLDSFWDEELRNPEGLLAIFVEHIVRDDMPLADDVSKDIQYLLLCYRAICRRQWETEQDQAEKEKHRSSA